MSSEEAVHVSLMEVTPTSGKGTPGTWWFLRQARAWLNKTEHINRSQGQGRSYKQTLRRWGVCPPALEPKLMDEMPRLQTGPEKLGRPAL
jgi:hypothetical protein